MSNVDLSVDDVPVETINTLVTHEDPDNKDKKEHANYTFQPDINTSVDLPELEQAIVMDSSGVKDIKGYSVSSNNQISSAIHSLQGTIFVPHGLIPANDYNNPALWIVAYPLLFLYGKGGPEMQRIPAIGLTTYISHLLSVADKKLCFDPFFEFHIFPCCCNRQNIPSNSCSYQSKIKHL